MRPRKQDKAKVDMAIDRHTEASSSLSAMSGSKGSTKQTTSLVDQAEKGRISTQQKPNAKTTNKTVPTWGSNPGKSSKNGEDSEKNYSRFPPLPTKSSSTPRKAKVSFPPSQQMVLHRRRLSVPEESINRLPKSILKKRLSVSVELTPLAIDKEQRDLSVLWRLPWERELYFPPMTHNGMLVYLDEDGSLPPMLRRLSNADTYHYSQEFLQVVHDLKDRPTS
ncbi:uncharacterized protein [Dendropsophus ebraccatus]|uniref:uncharacterized protein n=1 Tax=Dendropsophus ebraccatus TaxID=150705 RepID=UPI003831B3EB